VEARGAQDLYVSCAPVFESTFYIRRSIMIKRIFVLLLTTLFLAGTAVTLTGCNTVEGAGKDIQQGGKAIKDEANEHK
jgi:entericidin B